MAAATLEKKPLVSTDDLLVTLSEGEMVLPTVLEKSSEQAVAVAWARGEIEFGRPKYVVTGNPDTAVITHNGVSLPPPTLVIEGGLEWTGPKQRWHQSFAKLRAEKFPVCPRYQKYQLEMCINKEKDAWDWLADGTTPDGRETRYARRTIQRDEAEKLFAYYVRLTDKGMARLAGTDA